MKNFCRNQAGKLSLEAIGWMVLALLLVAAGGATAFSISANKTDSSQKLLTQKTIVCPAGSVALDVRQFIQAGVPIEGLVEDGGTVPGTGGAGQVAAKTIIENGPYTDIDGNGSTLTAEIVCVSNRMGY